MNPDRLWSGLLGGLVVVLLFLGGTLWWRGGIVRESRPLPTLSALTIDGTPLPADWAQGRPAVIHLWLPG